MWALHLKREALQSSLALHTQFINVSSFHFPGSLDVQWYTKKNQSMYHALLQPKTHDAMIWFSIILPASTIQRWAFRADPAMGYHGRYHEISLDVDALIWNDLNRKRMKWVEHLEPWLQSLHFCSNNHSPNIYIEIWQNVVSAQVYWYLLDHPKGPFSIHSYWESELPFVRNLPQQSC